MTSCYLRSLNTTSANQPWDGLGLTYVIDLRPEPSLEYYLTHSRWHKASHKDRFQAPYHSHFTLMICLCVYQLLTLKYMPMTHYYGPPITPSIIFSTICKTVLTKQCQQEDSRQIKWSQYRKKDKTTPHCHTSETAILHKCSRNYSGCRLTT